MAAGVYIRVSTYDQNPEGQYDEVRAWMKRNYSGEVLWYEDWETGRNLERVGFKELQRDIFAGKVDSVVVWKLDRLARSMRDGVNVITDWLARDVRIISVTQQIDLSGTFGRMIAGIMFAFAEMELETMKERQRAGIDAAKRRGVYAGRGQHKKGKTKAKPERARELKAGGLKTAEIANVLNVSERSVIRYLKQA